MLASQKPPANLNGSPRPVSINVSSIFATGVFFKVACQEASTVSEGCRGKIREIASQAMTRREPSERQLILSSELRTDLTQAARPSCSDRRAISIRWHTCRRASVMIHPGNLFSKQALITWNKFNLLRSCLRSPSSTLHPLALVKCTAVTCDCIACWLS